MQGQKAGLKARIENEKKRRRKQNEMNKSDHLSLLVNNHGNSMSHHKRYSDFLAGVEAIASIQKEKSARNRLVENRNRISADPEEVSFHIFCIFLCFLLLLIIIGIFKKSYHQSKLYEKNTVGFVRGVDYCVFNHCDSISYWISNST